VCVCVCVCMQRHLGHSRVNLSEKSEHDMAVDCRKAIVAHLVCGTTVRSSRLADSWSATNASKQLVTEPTAVVKPQK
jgi:hypothetical protein